MQLVARARGEGIVARVSSPPDPAVARELARLAAEVTQLRASLDGLAERLGGLVTENATLRARLEHSEQARADLFAQAEHVIELLADSRREVRALQHKGAAG
jgi:chromosome segregation ATPase